MNYKSLHQSSVQKRLQAPVKETILTMEEMAQLPPAVKPSGICPMLTIVMQSSI